MKSLGASVALTLLGGIGVFYGLTNLGFDNLAAQLAPALIALIPYIREFLEKTWWTDQNLTTAPVLSLRDFGLSPQRMTLYGTLIIFGAMQFGSALGGLSVIALGETRNPQKLYIIGAVANLVQLPIIFAVGCWIGRRCASYGIVVVLLTSFFARLFATLFDIWLLTPDKMGALLGSSVTGLRVALSVTGGTILLALITGVGYWRGKRQRLAAYLSYLLRSVTEETRQAIVDLAFQETRATITATHNVIK